MTPEQEVLARQLEALMEVGFDPAGLSELGRALASASHQAREVTCAECGQVFVAHSGRATTCSNKCRQRRKYRKSRTQ